MVINMDSIALHLQKKITQMMDFRDFVQFEESSKQGKVLGTLVSPPPVDFTQIELSSYEISLLNYTECCGKPHSTILPNRNRGKLRFSTSFFMAESSFKDETALEMIKHVEDGYVVTEDSTVVLLFRPDLSPDVFRRFLEVLDVSSFTSNGINTQLLPLLNKTKDVALLFMEDNSFIILKTPKVRIEYWTPSENPRSVMNQFFKEWTLNEREIIEFSLSTKDENQFRNVEELFSGLPYSILWSPETHESTIFSELPPQDVARFPRMFSIQSGPKTLFISIDLRKLCAKETSNVEEEMIEIKKKILTPAKTEYEMDCCPQCKLFFCQCA